MSQEHFIQQHEGLWSQFEAFLNSRGKLVRKAEGSKGVTIPPLEEIPHCYRMVCHHLSIAKSRVYSPALIARLNQMAIEGHALFYRSRQGSLHHFFQFWRDEFPNTLRREAKLVYLSALLFFGSWLLVSFLTFVFPELPELILGKKQIQEIEHMYRPGNHFRTEQRTNSMDVVMLAYYIYNNVSIGFQIFAGGLLLGLGSVFFLLFNGIFLGAITAHLINVGYATQLFSFTAGHSTFELIGIVFAGAAGLKLGYSIINPGRRPRGDALKHAAQSALTLVYGTMMFLLLAAFIEAFWSPLALLPIVKYAVGLTLFVLTLTYLLFAGRGYATR